MNKKKIGTGLIALALVGVVGVGGSLAWFTDNDAATNVFTTNHVEINIDETTTETENATKDENGITYSHVEPGDKISKNVTVTKAANSEDAWVRLVIRVTGDKVVTALTDNDTTNDIVFKKGETELELTWTPVTNDENKVVAATATYDTDASLVGADASWNPFTHVQVPTTWGNHFADATFTVELTAEAVQYDNNTQGFDAEGVVVEQYTAQ